MTIAIFPRLEKGDVVEIDFAIGMLIEETRVGGYTLQVLVEHNIEIAIGQLNSILCQTLLQVAEQQVSVVVFVIADKLLAESTKNPPSLVQSRQPNECDRDAYSEW